MSASMSPAYGMLRIASDSNFIQCARIVDMYYRRAFTLLNMVPNNLLHPVISVSWPIILSGAAKHNCHVVCRGFLMATATFSFGRFKHHRYLQRCLHQR